MERENILKDIDDLTDANQGLKRALDEAQQEVRGDECTCMHRVYANVTSYFDECIYAYSYVPGSGCAYALKLVLLCSRTHLVH